MAPVRESAKENRASKRSAPAKNSLNQDGPPFSPTATRTSPTPLISNHRAANVPPRHGLRQLPAAEEDTALVTGHRPALNRPTGQHDSPHNVAVIHPAARATDEGVRRVQPPQHLHLETPRPPRAPRPSNQRHDNEDAERDAIAELRAQLAAADAREVQLRAQLDAHASSDTSPQHSPESIRPISKPKGEAGNDGFNLRDAMGMSHEDDDLEYNDILRAVRRNAERCGIDFARTFRKQDPEVLGKVYKLGRRQFSYLTRERFANDWPQAEALKQYLKNYRRYQARLKREREGMLTSRSSTSRSRTKPCNATVRNQPPARSRAKKNLNGKRCAPEADEEAIYREAGPSRLLKRRRFDDEEQEEEEEEEEEQEQEDTNSGGRHNRDGVDDDDDMYY